MAQPTEGDSAATAQQVREWFMSQWCAGDKCVPSGNGTIKFRVEFHAEASAAEVAEVWRRVKDRVDHPRRAWAVRQQERLKHGPQIAASEFWRSESKWRFNETHFEPNGDQMLFIDRVWTPKVAWSLSPNDLHIADPRTPPSENAEFYRKSEIATELMVTACRGLFHGKIGSKDRNEASPEIRSIEPVGDRWVVSIVRPGDFEWRYTIDFDEASGQGRVDSMSSRKKDEDNRWRETGRTELSQEMVATAWGPAHRTAEWFNAEGHLTRRYVLINASPELPSDVESYFEVPDVFGVDPVRDEMTFQSIYDYRPGRGRLTRLAGTPGEATRPLAGAPTSGLTIRVIGWIVAGVIAAILVFLWARRRRAVSSDLS